MLQKIQTYCALLSGEKIRYISVPVKTDTYKSHCLGQCANTDNHKDAYGNI